MAFVRSKLERVAGGIQKLYIYNGQADTIATVSGAGYFNSVTSELDAGDVIICVCNSNASVDLAVVTSARGAASVTTMTVEGVTAT